MMKLFLVHASIRKSGYMAERVFEDMRIVHAASEQDAENTYDQYWGSKSEERAYDYSVLHFSCTEALVSNTS